LITANVSNQGGTVIPGASPGALTINGNYVQGPGGTLIVEIGGTTGGSQYDQLIVNGNATLGGTLNVTLVNGYFPAGGETYSIVQSSGAVSGTFASTNFPIPAFTTTYLPSGVRLLASVPVLPPPVTAASQVVVALTDQNQNTLVASQATGLPVEVYDSLQQQEQQAMQKVLMCSGSGSGGGGGGGGVTGGGGFRCNSRGCL
ncbi:MAG TPA: hypothetical protein VKD25_10810, partial [Burkholderiales bacterium]|nr:hypothetical protein [Burkholderiales bacterium]